jgi:hypothetical protein
MYSVWMSEHTATFDLHIIDCWVFINDSECVLCAVGLGHYIKEFTFCPEILNSLFIQ